MLKNYIIPIIKYLFLLLVSFSVAQVNGQTNQFIEYYGDICPDFGLSLDITNDGSYILLGHTQNFSAQNQDLWLVKIDSLGNVLWHKLFGGANLDFGQSIQVTKDKGYILCGFTNSFSAGDMDIYLVKTDSAGNFQWQQTYGGINNDYGYCIKQTFDGGFIVCGSTTSFGAGGTDAILIKTDSLGNQEWSQYFGGTNNDGAYSLDISSDSGYVLCGYTNNFGAIGVDAMIIKTDNLGNQQFIKLFGGSGSDRALCIKQCPDKGYCFSGFTNSYGNGSDNMYLVKTDSLGNLTYYKTFGGGQTDKAYSLDFTLDGGYILTGLTNSFGAGNNDLYVVRVDSSGNMIWQKYFGGFLNDEGFTVKSTRDKGFIAIGNTLSFNITYNDMFVVKMDSTGFASDINNFSLETFDLNIYPNPAKERLYINFNENVPALVSLIKSDGQVVFQSKFLSHELELNLAGFANGLYLLFIKTDNNTYSKKIIKE